MYSPRFITQAQLAELVELYHLARTALNGGRGAERHERLTWALKQFSEANPSLSAGKVYKDLYGATQGV